MAPSYVIQNALRNFIAMRFTRVNLGKATKIRDQMAESDWLFFYKDCGGLESEIAQIAQHDIAGSLCFADQHPEPLRSRLLAAAASEVANRDPLRALAILGNMDATEDRDTNLAKHKALATTACMLGAADFTTAARLIRSIPDDIVRSRALSSFAVQWFKDDSDSCGRILRELVPTEDPEVVANISRLVPDFGVEILSGHFESISKGGPPALCFHERKYPELATAYPIDRSESDLVMDIVDSIMKRNIQSLPSPELVRKLFTQMRGAGLELLVLHLVVKLANRFGLEYAKRLIHRSSSIDFSRGGLLQLVHGILAANAIGRKVLPASGLADSLLSNLAANDVKVFSIRTILILASAFADTEPHLSIRLFRVALELIGSVQNQAWKIDLGLEVFEALRSIDIAKAENVLLWALRVYEREITGNASYICSFLGVPPLRRLVKAASEFSTHACPEAGVFLERILSSSDTRSLLAIRDLWRQDGILTGLFLERIVQVMTSAKQQADQAESDDRDRLEFEYRLASAIMNPESDAFDELIDIVKGQSEPWHTTDMCHVIGLQASTDVGRSVSLIQIIQNANYRPLAFLQVVKSLAGVDNRLAFELSEQVASIDVNVSGIDFEGSAYFLDPRVEAFDVVARSVANLEQYDLAKDVLCAAGSNPITLASVVSRLLNLLLKDRTAFIAAYEMISSDVPLGRRIEGPTDPELQKRLGELLLATTGQCQDEQNDWWSSFALVVPGDAK
jgi:hypothetical protein